MRFAWLPGALIALLSFLLTAHWALTIRPLDAPDEPAHLQTVMEIRKRHILPEIHYSYRRDPDGQVIGNPGDAAVRAYTTELGYGDWSYQLVPYESKQPPLFYLAAAAAAHLVPAEPRPVLYVSRLVAALFGAATVFFIWAAVRELAPRMPAWAALAAGVVVLLPMFCFDTAIVSNDAAINFAAALAFFIWFRGLRRPAFDSWMLEAGAALGLAVLAKLWAVALVPGLVLVILFRAWAPARGPQPLRTRLGRFARLSLGATVGALAVCGWWLVRNLSVYGEPTGSQAALKFDQKFRVLDLQSDADRYEFLISTWQSLWGRFGWMNLWLPSDFYQHAVVVGVLGLGLSAVALVWVLARRREAGRSLMPARAWQVAAVLLVVTGGLIAAYLQFSLQIAFQGQARYLFPALLPMTLLVTGGLAALPLRAPIRAAVLGAPLVWLAVMNLAGLGVVR